MFCKLGAEYLMNVNHQQASYLVKEWFSCNKSTIGKKSLLSLGVNNKIQTIELDGKYMPYMSGITRVHSHKTQSAEKCTLDHFP